jgi:hypothetical protein
LPERAISRSDGRLRRVRPGPGFLVDATRVRHPKHKPRVERMVPYVRGSFFAGEHFIDRVDA